MARGPSQRRRLAAGLALALAAGVAGGAWLFQGARRHAAADAEARRDIVTLLALDDLAARAGGEGDRVRAVVRAWKARQSTGTEARVVLFQGLSLEASTHPADEGERAAPRRLARDEKPLYDRAQRLRSAVEGNRAGDAPKPELEVERLGGGRVLAAPLEAGGQVIGMVELTVPAPPPAPPPGWLLPLLAAVAAVALLGFWLVARPIGERRWPLFAAAAAALLVALAVAGAAELRALEAARSAAGAAVGEQVRAQAALAAEVMSAAALPAAPLAPTAWDADLYRRPRGLVSAEGAVLAAPAEVEASALRWQAIRALLAVVALAAALLAFVGLGGASWVGRTLVTNRQAYAYIAPAMIGTIVLVFFPFFYGIALSFTDSNIYNTSSPLTDIWIGLRNYASILGDFSVARRGADGALVFNYLNFYWTLMFTVIWTVTNVTWGVSFGLLLALVMNVKGLAFRPIYRVLLILPWAVPNYITALVWKGMFHRQFGVVNQALIIVGLQPISWFDRPFTSFLTALATNGWLSFPFMMMVSLGALQSIPADLYEAARVDGATRWQQFKAITLPSLRPALVPAVILSVVWTFNLFNIIYLVTGGEPNGATEILITQAYKFAFERYRYGYAAAYSTIIFGILLVYGVIQNRVTRATEGI